ncbi:hypothetical protein ACFO8O_15545 [Hephaestia sp. GCM10023244]|uniref:hypothetical protein n=1 Tax=unclassified Hephaestia TaxID=2631281 RepID=UPI002076FCC1|nr:hypothetical protein [Hephaestia sp. MAHUQ-44]MCM8732379.1 hypothetical protein [Hephaestia sp. MAHUQ-44]
MTEAVPGDTLAIRLIAGGATVLASSVLTDSGMEHYRGSFANPTMVLPLASSALGIAVNGRKAQRPDGGGSTVPAIGHAGAVTIGAVGLGFHAYNVLKRPGGATFTNLFYGAPAGAPAALILAGLLGKAANALAEGKDHVGPVVLASGRAIGAVAGTGILGSAGEAALLHVRGAYHDPFMWLPVTVPPIAAASLLRDVVEDHPRRATTILLGTTAALGLIGVGFHVYGVSRNMGGWRNWRQNILAGPPIPAPPAFTGLALAGLGALILMRRRHG